jgi:hypothetical protein
MPRAPKHCGHTDCIILVTGRPYCDEHTALHQQRGNTAQRGYGVTHEQERAQRLEALRDGDLCPRCGNPMYRNKSHLLDLDHNKARTGYRGLAHRRCNRQRLNDQPGVAPLPPPF